MGFLVAIVNAFIVSSENVFTKKLLVTKNKFFIAWLRLLVVVPTLALAVHFFSSWKIPDPSFWFILAGASLPLELLLVYLGYSALERTQLSFMAPLHSSTSIFLVPVGFFLLGELPTLAGFGGILLIVAGGFALGWQYGEKNPLRMAKNVFAEPGSYLILFVSFLASITISLAKILFTYAPPLLTAFYTATVLAIVLTPFALRRNHHTIVRGDGPLFTGLAAGSGLSFLLHYIGLSLLPAAYFIAIKRLSMFFDVIFGRVFFHEDHTLQRFSGAILMIVGIILIAMG